MTAAEIILWILGIYLGCGTCFAIAFTLRGAKSIDQSASISPLTVRLAWFPGAAALWPLLLAKWLQHKATQS